MSVFRSIRHRLSDEFPASKAHSRLPTGLQAVLRSAAQNLVDPLILSMVSTHYTDLKWYFRYAL
jgi:hypothetical protein